MQKKAAQTATARPVSSEMDIDIGVFDTYDRMVDKIKTMEDQAAALSELSGMDGVEEEFRKLERETEVEAELKAMKEKIQA